MRPRATDDVAPRGVPPLDLAPRALAARRLGVFGGSFDPPHAGHVWVAERAREARALDHVLFVPAKRPPHKPERRLAPDGDRLAMLALLFGARPWVSAWAGELRRTGPSYTVDTLECLRAALADEVELFLILGSDNLAGLAGWRACERVLSLARPIVLHRRGAPLDERALDALPPAASARVRAGFVDVEPFDASATAIRAALSAGTDPGPAFPQPLRDYARLRGLYDAAAAR